MIDFSQYYLHDLTRTYDASVAGYTWETAREINRDGWNARWLRLYSHAGTHMDAPRHFAVNDTGIEDYRPEQLMGKAWLIDAPAAEDQTLLEVSLVKNIADRFAPGDSLLFRTGWDQHFPTPRFRDGLPRISEALARWCVSQEVKILGVEGPSVANVNDLAEVTNIHRILLSGRVIIVEGLINLDKISAEAVTLIALPLKLREGDGSPARVLALEPRTDR
ncbi:MAG: cyclase family protein [Bacteroidota bacterium]